jgi:DNA (cytosine-5)-methyltransferase 1
MKILNLYAGIGGNRKLWGNEHEITAVENNESIANTYKQFFPNDEVIVGDAHEYLLEHFQEFDFIWSSPPCPSHSRMRKTNSGIGERKKPHSYPDMKLYQEIIFLTHFFKGKFVVENVIPYYEPLIKPQKIGRHYFWTNFVIPQIEIKNTLNIRNGLKREIGFDLKDIKLTHRKDQVMSNCVEPELGLHILNQIKELQ